MWWCRLQVFVYAASVVVCCKYGCMLQVWLYAASMSELMG
jgi:hypothetical protein